MFIDLGLLDVESEAVPEHLPQIGEEGSGASILIRVLLVQPLLDNVQRNRLLDLVEVGGEVEVSHVPEGDRLWPHVIHLQQQPPTELQVTL